MRSYIIASWNNADEFDYSGEILGGSREKSSQQLHINPDGTANTALYADKPRNTKTRTIRHKVVPQQVRLDNIEKLSRELEQEHKAGLVTEEEYEELSRVLKSKHDRAYQLLAKAMGWKDEDEQEKPAAYTWTESKAPVGTAYAEKDSIFLTLPVDNSFRRAYTWLQKAKMTLKSLKG